MMKSVCLTGLFSFFVSANALAQTTYHLGLGLGPEYAGLGASAERVTDHGKLTLGAGLVNSHRVVGEVYGASLLYHRFDLIDAGSGRHALGLGVAPVGQRWSYTARFSAGQWQYTTNYHDVIYGGVVAYNFHPRGAQLGGFHLGISYGYGSRSGETASGLQMNFGYRFN